MTDRSDPVLARAGASPMRRSLAALVLGSLGVLLVALGTDRALGAIWQSLYVAMGFGAGLAGYRLWQATYDVLELTKTELRTTSGRRLARIENVRSVDRGAFAFKPSNGFLVTLKAVDGPRAWAPGLWWRVGRRIGVGGVMSAGEAKAMAEVLTALITGVLPEDADA